MTSITDYPRVSGQTSDGRLVIVCTEGKLNAIIPGCGLVTENDIKYARVCVRESHGGWVVVDPAMHPAQHRTLTNLCRPLDKVS